MTTTPDSSACSSEQPSRSPETSACWVGCVIALLLAGGCWIGGALLDGPEPLQGGVKLWLWQGGMVLRDTLRAGAVVLVSMAVGMVAFGGLARWDRRFWRMNRQGLLLAAVLVTLVASVWTAYVVLDHMPHIPDEVAMVFQAKNFAAGQFYAPAPPAELVPFFDTEFVTIDGTRWYGRYFAGPSVLMAPLISLHMEWLVNPVLGALSVLLIYALGKELLGEKAGRMAAILATLSPFLIVNSGWMMSHAGCLFFGLLYAVYLLKAARQPRQYSYWILAAVGVGAMLHYRPLTMLMVAGPVAVAAGLRCRWRDVRPAALLAFGLPIAGFVALFLLYNQAMTGDVWTTPFEPYCATERLGFGPDVGLDYLPEDLRHGHTPADGLNYTRINFDKLGVILTGWGRGTLVLMVCAFCLRRRRGVFLLAAAVPLALAGAHFFYYTSGEVYGVPRFLSEAMGFLFVLVVGGLAELRCLLGRAYRWFGCGQGDARARAALWVAVLSMTAGSMATVFPQYVVPQGQGSEILSSALRETVKRQPLKNAVVFVDTPWFRDRGMFEIDRFGAALILNSPNLGGDIVFARDRGEDNPKLLDYLAGRKAYRYVNDEINKPHFEPIEP